MSPSDFEWPAPLPESLRGGVARLREQVSAAAPCLGERLSGWMTERAGGQSPEAYFTHPYAFPMFLFPWWLEEELAGEPDPEFQAELVYAFLAAYYLIRITDDVMDEGDPGATALLPAVWALHAEFQGTYARLFLAGDPFWSAFFREWGRGAEASFRDAAPREIDADEFARVSAEKVRPAVLPLLAVCHRYGWTELPPAWEALFARFSRWHQFHNDLFDWQRDHQRGIPTYFLGEAARRSAPGESLPAWVAREGFNWGIACLDGWMTEMDALAAEVGAPGLPEYLAARRARLAAVAEDARQGLAVVARLARAGLA